MAAHDRGLLIAQEVELFAMWLKKNGKQFRIGRGEFQIIQVELAKGWGAICRDAKGVVTTPQEIRPLIEAYKADRNIAQPAKNPGGKSADRKALDALRDELAMLAAESFLPAYRDLCDAVEFGSQDQVMAALANHCYSFANHMLVAREELRIKE